MANITRRRYLIDKRLQTKFILLTMFVLLLYTLLFALILFVPYMLKLSSAVPLGEQTRAARAILTLHTTVWPALGIVVVVMGLLSIFISHKIAGPVYRLEKILAQTLDGDLNVTVRLRKNDELQGLAEGLEKLIADQRQLVDILQVEHDRSMICRQDIEARIARKEICGVVGKDLLEQLSERQKTIAGVLDKYALRTGGEPENPG